MAQLSDKLKQDLLELKGRLHNIAPYVEIEYVRKCQGGSSPIMLLQTRLLEQCLVAWFRSIVPLVVWYLNFHTVRYGTTFLST